MDKEISKLLKDLLIEIDYDIKKNNNETIEFEINNDYKDYNDDLILE